MTQPIRIAGGGLSGLATALLLGRSGVAVEVFDRHHGGGGRFAGGWQVIENGTSELDALSELGALGLMPAHGVIPVRRAVFFAGQEGRWEIASREPYAYFIRRGGVEGSLDAWLRRSALDVGVRMRDGEVAPPDVEVVARGPACADGVAREVMFRSTLPDTVAVLFDPRVTPSGYAYLFCLDGFATFGVAQVREVKRIGEARELAWRRFRRELGEFKVEDVREHGQFMNFFLPAGLRAADGRWYVGECAGVQDFLFGLGNRLALRSSALAVEGMLGRWDEARYRRTVFRPMQNTIALRFAYERLRRADFSRFCRVASQRDFRSLLVTLQRPRRATLAVTRLVMALWRERRGCRHGELCTWCRRREA